MDSKSVALGAILGTVVTTAAGLAIVSTYISKKPCDLQFIACSETVTGLKGPDSNGGFLVDDEPQNRARSETEPELSSPESNGILPVDDAPHNTVKASNEANYRELNLDSSPTDVAEVSPNIAETWPDRQRALLDDEPRDDSWSFFMEDAILQFLSGHPGISQFDISYIECRTTVCQVQVVGFDESTGPSWHRIMDDMRRQEWFEFGERGNSFGDVEGQFVVVEKMYRLDENR